MVDGISVDVSYLNESLNSLPYTHVAWDKLIKSGVVVWEINHIENLQIKKTRSYIRLIGSLHIYYNIRQYRIAHNIADKIMLTDRQNIECRHNYNMFTYSNLQWVLNDLEHRLGVKLADSKVHRIELGVNIAIEEDPAHYIIKHFYSYDKRYHISPKLVTGGDRSLYTEVNMSQSKVKLYNKSGQYGIANNLLRIEFVVSKMQVLDRSVDISFKKMTLADLKNRNKYHELAKWTYQKFMPFLIVDSYSIDLAEDARDFKILASILNRYYYDLLKIVDGYSTERIEAQHGRVLRTLDKYELLNEKRFVMVSVKNLLETMLNSDVQGPDINRPLHLLDYSHLVG